MKSISFTGEFILYMLITLNISMKFFSMDNNDSPTKDINGEIFLFHCLMILASSYVGILFIDW